MIALFLLINFLALCMAVLIPLLVILCLLKYLTPDKVERKRKDEE